MRRADRLFDIVQALRGGRTRTAAELAGLLEVSVRTVYRDVAALVASGIPIDGEAGVGYVLRPGHLLPPLALTDTERQALTLGARLVAAWADGELGRAAHEVLAKLDAAHAPLLGARAPQLRAPPGRGRARQAGDVAARAPGRGEAPADLRRSGPGARQPHRPALVAGVLGA